MAELEVLDYPQIALSLLIETYQDSEDLKKILSVITEAELELQTTIFEVRDRFILPTATGASLTIIGRVWDLARRLDVIETDDEFRGKIDVKAEISISGTVPEIKQALFFFYGATSVVYAGDYPAGFELTTDAIITQMELDAITASGVQGVIL